MLIPNSTFAVVAFIVLFVPGFVFAVVRTSIRGFRADDKGLDTRIAQALVVSVIFDAAYLIFVYSYLRPQVKLTTASIEILEPAQLGVSILVGGIAVPALVAAVVYSPWRVQRVRVTQKEGPSVDREAASQTPPAPRTALRVVRRWRYSNVPTAWGLGCRRLDE